MHPLVGEQSYSRDLLKSPCPAGLDRFAHRGLRARASTCRRSPVRGFHPGVSRVSCSWRCALGEQFPLSPNLPERKPGLEAHPGARGVEGARGLDHRP